VSGKAMIIRGGIVVRIEGPVFASYRQVLWTADAVLRSSGRISRCRYDGAVTVSYFALCRSW
jgi:hypothetical protein